MALSRLRYNKQLYDEVIHTYMGQICTHNRDIRSSALASLYTERFVDYDFNYISDTQTI